MKKWKESKIKELIQNKNGYTWSKEQELQKYEEKSIRVLTVSNIQKELDLSVELYLQNVSEEDKIEKKVSKNWIIAVSSNGNRNRIGNPVFIKENMDFLFASFLTAFKPKNENELSPEFFFYWMSTNSVQQKITAVSEGTTGLGNMNLRHFKNMKISYPELEEQNAIAGIISKVDQCIENTQKTIDATQKLKKSLMQNLLTGRMKPDGTMRKDNEFYDHPKMGKIPIGWEINILKDIFTINDESLSSKTDPKFKFRYITIESINTENIDYENCPTYNFEDAPGRARRIIKDNDLLISGVRPNLKGFAIYKKPNDENWICTTGCYVLRAKEQQDYRFYFYQILSDIGASQFYGWVSGTNYPAISDRDIRRLKLYSPTNYEEQKEIANKIDLITKQITEKQNKINKLKILKKSLMQNLLTGKIRVDVEKINHLLESMK